MNVKVGVEKECLIFDQSMNPVDLDLDHLPQELVVDFANHQLEVVLAPHSDVLQVEQSIEDLLSIDYFSDKLIWPLSLPLAVNNNVKYDKLDKEYRAGLAAKYGIDKMLYSGIHFNYSNDLLKTTEQYFQLIQSVYEYLPIIIQFTSFSPYAHGYMDGLEQIGKNYGLKNSISLRCSNQYGFSNEKDVHLDFSSYQNYLDSRAKILSDGSLIDEREIYSKIRLKKASSDYIELRFLDINPFVKSGISEETLILVVSLLNYLSLNPALDFNYPRSIDQTEAVSLNGRDRSMNLTIDGQTGSLQELTLSFLDKLITSSSVNTHRDALTKLRVAYQNNHLDLDLMCQMIESQDISVQQFGLDNLHYLQKFEPILAPHDLELSTKLIIQEAQKQGYNVTIESEHDNIIKVSNQNTSHYLVMATKTNLDRYANVLLMDNKYMTKKILSELNISVPTGLLLKRGEKLPELPYQKVVVKPLDTNFGLGITICESSDTNLLNQAIKHAFEYSDPIIIEQYISGDEYRLLVIDGVVEGVITRKNANIIGDGQSTIEQLIAKKNASPLRSRGYRTPLEEIIIDDDLIEVITRQGYKLSDVIPAAVKVVLRNTSNVSQGGDSYEVFEKIPEYYKQIAVKAASGFDAAICGVDMIIDFATSQYAIIEVNYNPAIHMHMFPYRGRGRNVAAKVLEALFKKKD